MSQTTESKATVSKATVSKATMGKIVVKLTLTNEYDAYLAEKGFIKPEEVRSCVVEDALVDTGAKRLCLPADVIERLGLKQTATIDANTAVGIQTLRMFKGLQLNIEGREGRYDCVELPVGQTPLLGLIPLEDLGLDPDLQNQKLKHLPMHGKDTYLTVL